jgi:hypothetical protein
MPLTILLNAAASRLTGEFLFSGKMVSLGSMALVLVLVFMVLRRLGCTIPCCLALTSTVVATLTGFDEIMSIRGDAPAVFLQLGAVAVVAEGMSMAKGRTRFIVALAVAAAALSALAILAKLSAVWAPLAIGCWLFTRDRRALLAYVSAFSVLLLGSLALFQLASHGNMFDSLFGLAFAGVAGAGPIARSVVLGHDIMNSLRVSWVLFPIAVLEVITAYWGRRLSVYHLSFLFAIGVTWFVYMDVGVEANHLIDLAVLIAIVVGEFWARVALPVAGTSGMHILLTVLLIWIIPTAYAGNVGRAPQEVIEDDYGKGTQRSMEAVLAGSVRPTDRILSFDPTVPVGLGQFPEVLDFFMFARIQAKHPQMTAALVDRIRRREFDKIVHIDDIAKPEFSGQVDLGPQVVAEIRANYRLVAHVRDYYVYAPISVPASRLACCEEPGRVVASSGRGG